MIRLKQKRGDSRPFLTMVEQVLNRTLRESAARRAYVVKIDKWFTPKWCGFSGEQHGILGLWKPDLTLPPFVPSRVVDESCYEMAAGGTDYERVPHERGLHLRQASSDNLKRFVRRFDDGAAFYWYSGSSAELGRGCLMAYLPSSKEYWNWYAELLLRKGPQVGLLRGISRHEILGCTLTDGVDKFRR